jgi:hypothetical protein
MATPNNNPTGRQRPDARGEELATITRGTPATQQDAPQHIAEDDPGLDPVDAASADSFPTSDPPASSNPSAL